MQIRVVVIAILIASSSRLSAFNPIRLDTIDVQPPLFNDTSLLQLEIRADFNAICTDIGTNPRYHEATVQYKNIWGGSTTLKAEVRTRGIYRRNPCNCDFPPLLLKFNAKESESTLFEGIDKLKLVTHCQSNSRLYQEVTLREYLVYRAYKLFTDYSYRVRLAEIRYIDESSLDTLTRYGFFIEPDMLLSKRVNGIVIGQKNIHPNATNHRMATLMSTFQYMIGHTDWSIKALHNITLLETERAAPPIPVPFDFDFSGVVNAPYALPAEALPIHSVRERLFNGYCRTMVEFQQIFSEFNLRKEAIYQLYRSFPLISDSYKRRTLEYFDNFYAVISSPKKTTKEFVKHCRTD